MIEHVIIQDNFQCIVEVIGVLLYSKKKDWEVPPDIMPNKCCGKGLFTEIITVVGMDLFSCNSDLGTSSISP